MKRLLVVLGTICLTLILIVPVVAGCAAPAPTPTPSPSPSPPPSPSPTPGPTPTEEVYHWKMQHGWGSGETWLFEQFVEVLTELTGGRIVIDTLVPDGGLVPASEVHHALKTGVLDIAFDAGWWYEDVMPVCHIEYLVGMMSSNIEESFCLWDTRVDGDGLPIGFGLTDIFREEYLKVEGIYYVAPHFNDDTRLWLREPISKLEDLEGRILWVPHVVEDTLPVGFANSTIPPEELYTSLAAGIIDGVEWGGPACGWDMGWHEVVHYILARPRMMSCCTWHFVMAPEKWEALPPDLQAAIVVAVGDNSRYMRTAYEYRNRAKRKIMVEEYGLNVIDLGPEGEAQHMVWEVEAF